MQSQVATLQGKIMAEDKAMEQRAVDLLNEWEKGKPIQVSIVTIVLVSLYYMYLYVYIRYVSVLYTIYVFYANLKTVYT